MSGAAGADRGADRRSHDTFSKPRVRLGNVARPLTQNNSSTGPSPVGINESGVAVTQTGTAETIYNLFLQAADHNDEDAPTI